MSRENSAWTAFANALKAFQSAPGAMSREKRVRGERTASESESFNPLPADEPGELQHVAVLVRGQVFQSAPGSMSRENSVNLGHGIALRVSIRSRLDEPGEPRTGHEAARLAEVSIRSRLDEPGELCLDVSCRHAEGVSIRSRLDEPGEHAIWILGTQ